MFWGIKGITSAISHFFHHDIFWLTRPCTKFFMMAYFDSSGPLPNTYSIWRSHHPYPVGWYKLYVAWYFVLILLIRQCCFRRGYVRLLHLLFVLMVTPCVPLTEMMKMTVTTWRLHSLRCRKRSASLRKLVSWKIWRIWREKRKRRN